MADFVFPEDTGTGASDGDNNDAANFATAYDAIGLKNYVVQGLNFTLNASTPSLDISAGKAVVDDPSSTATQSGETRDEGVAFTVELDARSGLSLTDNDVNHVFLQVDLSSDDTVNIVINTTNSAPAEPQVKLGTVDTSNDTTTELNRATPVDLGDVQQPTSTVDFGGQAISNVGTYQGVTPDVDIGGQTSVTAASSDEVLIEDASDAGNKKKVTAQSVADLAGGGSDLQWTEDGNSPLTGSGNSSYTLTLANTFDIWKFIIRVKDNSGNFVTPDLQVNGDTGNNYDILNHDGSITTNTPGYELGQTLKNGEIQGIVTVEGRFAGNITFKGELSTERSTTLDFGAERGINTNITSPLTDITIVEPNAYPFEVVVEAYGRDIQ